MCQNRHILYFCLPVGSQDGSNLGFYFSSSIAPDSDSSGHTGTCGVPKSLGKGALWCPFHRCNHFLDVEGCGEETWTTYRNHRDFLQKLPWFPSEVAVISCNYCRDFLKKLPWFPEEITAISDGKVLEKSTISSNLCMTDDTCDTYFLRVYRVPHTRGTRGVCNSCCHLSYVSSAMCCFHTLY